MLKLTKKFHLKFIHKRLLPAGTHLYPISYISFYVHRANMLVINDVTLYVFILI